MKKRTIPKKIQSITTLTRIFHSIRSKLILLKTRRHPRQSSLKFQLNNQKLVHKYRDQSISITYSRHFLWQSIKNQNNNNLIQGFFKSILYQRWIDIVVILNTHHSKQREWVKMISWILYSVQQINRRISKEEKPTAPLVRIQAAS